MSIEEPRTFPPFFVGGGRFVLVRNDLSTPDNAGRLGGVTLGWPRWRFEYDIIANTDSQAAAWEAWIDSLLGAQRTFLAHDHRRMLPGAYIDTGLGGWDGDFGGYSFDTTRTVGAFTGSFRNFLLQNGDFIAHRDVAGAKHHMSRVIEGGLADASGNISVTINPALPAVIDEWDDPVAYVFRPACTMRLVAAETQIGDTSPQGQMQGRIVAVQDLR